jgi:rhodanese-related sulfurtransferase
MTMASGTATVLSSHSAPEISRDELQRRLDDRSLIIVDARPGAAYLEEHLPRAINLPVTEVDALAAKLLPDRSADIAVYCASFT